MDLVVFFTSESGSGDLSCELYSKALAKVKAINPEKSLVLRQEAATDRQYSDSLENSQLLRLPS